MATVKKEKVKAKMSKKYLIIGSGGREHALARSIGKCAECFVLPGNPGMVQDAQIISGNASDFEFVAGKAKELDVSAVIVGPEVPLCDGIADYLESKGIFVFGPKKGGAKLEGSKIFAKDFMKRHSIPTADSESFSSEETAMEFVKKHDFPIVIKVDGLAAGKGVHVVDNMFGAETVLHGIFSDGKFGVAGKKIIVEEFLVGKELSVLAITDGKTIKPLPPSRDHKQLGDGNKGPMTGGMGAFCPVPGIGSETYSRIKNEILDRTLDGLKKDGIDYRGVVYCGLMLTKSGPKVLEYNCRFGDPETQVVLPQLATPFPDIIEAVKNQTLDALEIKAKRGFSACVVLASEGYPVKTKIGYEITGIEKAREQTKSEVIFAGVAEQSGKLVTSGGRVLACVGSGKTLRQALGRAYRLTSIIDFKGRQMRGDIGGRYARRSSSIVNLRLKIRLRRSQKSNRRSF